MTTLNNVTNNKYILLFWIVMCSLGISFAFISALYPFFSDDFWHLVNIGATRDSPPTLEGVIKNIAWSYNMKVSRVGEYLLFFVLYILWHAKWVYYGMQNGYGVF